MIAKPKKQHIRMNSICGTDLGSVITPGPARSPKRDSLFTKAKAVIFEGKSSSDAGRARTPQKRFNGVSYTTYPPNDRSGGGASITLPRVPKQEDYRNQSSSSSQGDRNGSQQADPYQIRPPPPGSYQDDDTGPSPKNLVMAVMGVKSAVSYFAKVLIADMLKHPKELGHLEQTIFHEVQGEVDRPNHWKFLVQAFVCKRLFEGFETKNGFFGIESFAGLKMSSISSFVDFTTFKDKAATISGLLAKNSEDVSFLGQYCFKKFKSISGDLATNQPLPFYIMDWTMVERQRHPQSEFYQSFLKVAVSVWLLHRLVHSFEQVWSMLGWETFPKGFKFQRKSMESVVPGGFEEEDEETGTDLSAVVGFLVIPGFQVSKSVVKCEVYLRNENNLNDGKFMEATEVPSRDKTLEKLFSDESNASYQTPQKSYASPTSLSYTSPADLQTADSFRSSLNLSGDSSRAVAKQASTKFWTDPQTRASLGHLSNRSKNDQESSPNGKSGHLESKGRAQTTHILPMTPTSSSNRLGSRPPGYAARDNFRSRQRAAMNKRSV